ncbi:MAG TPA: hypothetical protein VKS80_16850 [Trinickia sp.]|nr:hypothetical protein [Trinickia sp.]
MANVADMTFGPRAAYTQADLTDAGTTFTQVAQVDGFVMATVGQPTVTVNYLGTLEGSTYDSSGTLTSFVYATGLAYLYQVSGSKKGVQTIQIPVPGSFTMPVREGETWKLVLTWNEHVGPPPQIEFYWIPANGQGVAERVSARRASPMAEALGALRADLGSGKVQRDMLASAQRAIDARVTDLAQILGDAVNPKSGASERKQFLQDLQKIVCSATPPGERADNRVAPADMQALVATFGTLAGSAFTPAQGALLEAGVRALVQINDNDVNRQDFALINRNIGLFLDNAEQALDTQFSVNERRLLTRALVRIVGDGSHGER